MKAILLLLITIQFVSAKTYKFSTLEWPPYIGSKLKNQGVVAQIVREAYRAVGHEVTFEFLPWSRAVKLAKEGDYDGLLPEYYSKDNSSSFTYSNSFLSGPVGLYTTSYSNIKRASNLISTIKGKRVGLVRGYVNTKVIDKGIGFTKDYASSDLINLRKLKSSRVDLIFIDHFVAQYLIDNNFKRGEFKFLTPAYENKKLYICFSKKKKDHMEKRDLFNKGLKLIKNKIPRILELHQLSQ
ncbi:MAG: hypothetical protein BM556_13200 [Bacteriovorax sp. MedPE-SWde]|nr:MAG: hypothetical protein BM556_13200 [Bacteriovorax sp. MedPE-SWde]